MGQVYVKVSQSKANTAPRIFLMGIDGLSASLFVIIY